MKHWWVYLMLVLSLGMNAGVLAVYGVRKYRQYRCEEHLVRTMVKNRAALRQLYREGDMLARRSDSLSEFHWQARRELGRLALEENPDSAAVEAAIGRMVEVDRSRFSATFDLFRRFRQLERPEYRAKFSRLDQQSAKAIDSIRAEDSIAAAAENKEER
jgi:Spy/CpxP family protein refolding chaperone